MVLIFIARKYDFHVDFVFRWRAQNIKRENSPHNFVEMGESVSVPYTGVSVSRIARTVIFSHISKKRRSTHSANYIELCFGLGKFSLFFPLPIDRRNQNDNNKKTLFTPKNFALWILKLAASSIFTFFTGLFHLEMRQMSFFRCPKPFNYRKQSNFRFEKIVFL